MMVIAHGGETITPTGSGHVRVSIEDHRTRVWVDDVEQIVNRSTRRDARNASRSLPGNQPRY